MLKKFARKIARILGILLLLQFLYAVSLKWINPPITPNMMVSIFKNISTDEPFQHKNISYDAMGNNIKWAVIASEDQKFGDHYGFDLASIKSSIGDRKSRKRGASTITQQTAKNLFLKNDRSWIRKGLEAFFTIELELLMNKSRILQHYLNIAEFGPNVYGIESAALYYFAKSAEDLNTTEADFLAAILPSPIKRGSTEKPKAESKARWISKQIPALKKNKELEKIVEGD